jgi:hypothetical protein
MVAVVATLLAPDVSPRTSVVVVGAAGMLVRPSKVSPNIGISISWNS